MRCFPPEGGSIRPCRGHRRGGPGGPAHRADTRHRHDARAHAGASSSILCEGSAKLSSVKSTMGEARTSRRPSGRLQIKGPGGRTRWSPRSRGRSEPAFASTRTPARPVHYNPDFVPLSSEPPAGSPRRCPRSTIPPQWPPPALVRRRPPRLRTPVCGRHPGAHARRPRCRSVVAGVRARARRPAAGVGAAGCGRPVSPLVPAVREAGWAVAAIGSDRWPSSMRAARVQSADGERDEVGIAVGRVQDPGLGRQEQDDGVGGRREDPGRDGGHRQRGDQVAALGGQEPAITGDGLAEPAPGPGDHPDEPDQTRAAAWRSASPQPPSCQRM